MRSDTHTAEDNIPDGRSARERHDAGLLWTAMIEHSPHAENKNLLLDARFPIPA
jgi:hypothetical protein